MSKRILFGSLLAMTLTLSASNTAHAQHFYPGHGGFHHGHGGFHSRPIVVSPVVPVYRPVVVAPAFGGGLHNPYFGFGNGFTGPGLGFNNFGPGFGGQGFGFNNFGPGFGGPGVLNIGYSRPGFGINFGTIIR